MVSPGKIQAGAAAIALTLEDDQFKKDWASLRSSLNKTTSALKTLAGIGAGVGLAVTGAFAAMTKVGADAESSMRRATLVFGEGLADVRSSRT